MGNEVVKQLRDLNVKKTVLIQAAEQGYITEVACAMPKCYCPMGPRHFDPVTDELSDWSPTHEHYPIPKRDGGRCTPDNSILAHRLCNRIDYSISVGRSHKRDLARIEEARRKAAQ